MKWMQVSKATQLSGEFDALYSQVWADIMCTYITSMVLVSHCTAHRESAIAAYHQQPITVFGNLRSENKIFAFTKKKQKDGQFIITRASIDQMNAKNAAQKWRTNGKFRALADPSVDLFSFGGGGGEHLHRPEESSAGEESTKNNRKYDWSWHFYVGRWKVTLFHAWHIVLHTYIQGFSLELSFLKSFKVSIKRM